MDEIVPKRNSLKTRVSRLHLLQSSNTLARLMKGKLLYEVFECLVDISIAVIAVVALSLALSHGEVHRDGISQSVCDGVSDKVAATDRLQFPHIPKCTWTPDVNNTNATATDGICTCGYIESFNLSRFTLLGTIMILSMQWLFLSS